MTTETRRRVAILTTSDIHGFIQPYSYTEDGPSDLGFARIAGLIEGQRRLWGDHMLYVDNGDNLQGSPLAYYQAKVDSSVENVMISCLNAAGCCAAVVGNHEFNFGLSYLQEAMRQSVFPWLSANILSAATGEPAFGRPYLVHDTPDGIRIAVLGLTTAHIPMWELPEHIEGLRFEDPVACAKLWVPYLRNQEAADVVVVAYHGGFERDLLTGEPTEALTGENQGSALCQEVEGIDVLLTGHQHRHVEGIHLHGVAVIQPGTQGQFLGRVILELESGGIQETSSQARTTGDKQRWRVVSTHSELIPAGKVEPLGRILELTAPVEARLQQWLDQTLGETAGDMLIMNVRKARLEEHPFIEWINRVQMEVSGAPISCTALFDEHTPGFGEHISMRDILANYKFPNTLRVLRVTGRDIREALEKSAEYFILEQDGRIGVNPAFLLPKPQPYNYDMWEGIEYVLDVSRPPGQRVVRLEMDGAPMLSEAEYEVVMNNYRAGGGGGFDMFRGKPIIRELPTDIAELLADYIRAKQTVTARANHNWRVIGGI
ncbi:bifunctional metallophosphatase/5'-nucleotidase [Paenibacillus sp. P96]|uniref:Bifunctional metallophosphatase/5'-nucleotidase n=1 Tax=Paenibacillus zeirhizosphaerae TaxID=2987519 RepID=A0ABT9FWT6_9BACL|nr:bifunctional UDP-sugar hydrolase/5'-nucleotidase [Paenibacillus sp. P96]MDP4099095.1 bifunctional metallophosphatase/5'-nucleotidase [Paenibacillus sp. P96]